jgi:tetratricopeptide (TPR) repeat protein
MSAEVEALSRTAERYFGEDRKSVLAVEFATAEAAINALPATSRKEQAQVEYLRGKALMCIDSDASTVERHLSKSLKQDPCIAEAWHALGDLYWKQGNCEAARNCLEQALEQCDKHAGTLRRLSVITRKEASEMKGADANATYEKFAEAVAQAKEALTLDTSDPENWYILGNGFFALFVNGGCNDRQVLCKCLSAYRQAEKGGEGGCWEFPDLYYNRAEAWKLDEEYGKALADLDHAHRLDPSLGADAVASALISNLQHVQQLVTHQGRVKQSKLSALTSSIDSPEGTLALTVSMMSTGLAAGSDRNEGTLAAKLVSVVDRGGENPLECVCVDSDSAFFVLAVWNVDANRLRSQLKPKEDTLWVNRPRFHTVHIEKDSRTKEIHLPWASISFPGDLSVNGKKVAMPFLANSVFTNST